MPKHNHDHSKPMSEARLKEITDILDEHGICPVELIEVGEITKRLVMLDIILNGPASKVPPPGTMFN
jgi:hypothetical protein